MERTSTAVLTLRHLTNGQMRTGIVLLYSQGTQVFRHTTTVRDFPRSQAEVIVFISVDRRKDIVVDSTEMA